jgi:hypothetical protein
MMEEEIKPIVYASTRNKQMRGGRGFSREEIKLAGLTLHRAKMLAIPIDKRRRTTHSKNVETLKGHLRKPVPLIEIKGIGKATEEELKKASILDAYDLAIADIDTLAEKTPHGKKSLKRWQREAQKLLKE